MTTETYQFTVGSSEGCEVMIKNASISRAHLKVYFSGESILVEDLSSREGTYVLHEGEYKRIKSAKIKPGTIIRLGSKLQGQEVKEFIELYFSAVEKEKRDIIKQVKSSSFKRCSDCGSVLRKVKIHCECCGAIFEEAA